MLSITLKTRISRFLSLTRMFGTTVSKIDKRTSTDKESSDESVSTVTETEPEAVAPMDKTPSGLDVWDAVGTEKLTRWQSTLSLLSTDLTGLSQSTEKEFLYLGDRLNHINSVNSQNADLAARVVDNLHKGKGADLDLLTGLLNNGFEKADRAEVSLSELSSELEEMVKRIKEIVILKEMLDRTYRSLRMVRVMIHIETENAGYKEYHTVAEALNKLEDLITQNAEKIHQSAEETNKLILGMLTQLNSDQHDRQRPLKAEQNSILNLMAIISEEISISTNTSQQMGDHTTALSKEIFEIVTNLQFHDNYRQRLEHISHTLQEIQSRIPEPGGDLREELAQLKPWGTTVINLQVAQLENLKTENISVSGKLSKSFENIQEILKAQSETADCIIPTMESLDHHVGELDQVLKNFYTQLGAYEKANSEMIASTDYLSSHISGITQISALIETNELNLRLLALNSMIKAARIGRHGKPLAVLSREINTISQSVQQQISDRKEIMKAIQGGSTHISSTLLENLRTSMNSMNETFDQTGDYILKLLEKDEKASDCSQVSKQLKADFSDLMEKLQVGQTIDNALDKIIQELRHTAGEFESLLPEPENAESENGLDLQALISQYTVQSERDIHQATVSSDSPSQDEVSQDDEGDLTDEDLGDNFELF